jgi:hypothetical protein
MIDPRRSGRSDDGDQSRPGARLGSMSYTPVRPSWVVPVIAALAVLLAAAVTTVVLLLVDGSDNTQPGGAPVDDRVIQSCRMLEAAAGSQDPARYKAVAMIAKEADDEDIARQGGRLDRAADFASLGVAGEPELRQMLGAAGELDKTCDERGY